MHGCYIGKHGGKLVLDDLKACQRLAKLDALLRIGKGDFIGGNGMAHRLPGHTGACGSKHERGILEAARERETIPYRHMHIVKRDIRLPDSPLGYLPCHNPRIEARCPLLDKESAHVAFIVTGPDNGDVGEGSVADPALGSVNDVIVAYAMSAGLQGHRVRAMVWLGQAKCADLLHTCHWWQPVLLLLL